jgi:hypothetical protein
VTLGGDANFLVTFKGTLGDTVLVELVVKVEVIYRFGKIELYECFKFAVALKTVNFKLQFKKEHVNIVDNKNI